jgi:probable HAF family extracellular repeat protein
MRTCVALVMAAAVIVSSAAYGAAQTYTVLDLGTLGGRVSFATAITRTGDVIGYSTLTGDAYRATSWRDGTPTSLGVLPGKTDSFAVAINVNGRVVGNASSAIYYNRRAFLWTSDTGLQDLGTLGGPGSQSAATGINSSDQIVGWSTLTSDPAQRHAFSYTDGNMADLGIGTASAISEDGVIVGDNGEHAVVWYTATDPVDLGTLGGRRSSSLGINEWGLVFGWADEDPDLPIDQHPFIWDPANGMMNLGTLGGDQGVVHAMTGTIAVGEAQTASGAFHAMIYDLNGPGYPVDLNDLIPAGSGWELRTATGINAAGQIVGDGLVNGRVHAFLLTPVATAPR